MKFNIFSKLMLTYALLIFLTLLVLGLSLSHFLTGYFFQAKEQELILQGKKIGDITSDYLIGRLTERELTYTLDTLDDFLDAKVWVVNKAGLILAASQSSMRGKYMREYRLTPEEMAQVLNGQIVRKVGLVEQFNEVMVSTAVPIIMPLGKSGDVIGAVFLYAPLTGIKSTLEQVHIYLGYAMLLAIGLSTILGLFLSRSITRPLSAMNRKALAMAHGDYTGRVAISSQDEVGELAESINYLAARLSETINDLHQEKSKVDSIVESVAEGVLAVSKDGKVIRLNPPAENLLSLKSETAVGKDITEVLPDPDMARLFVEVLSGRKIVSQVLALYKKKIKLMVSPIIGHNQEVFGAVGLLQDVSEAEALEQMRREFVTNVSHELRTPLTAIRGYNEALMDGTVKDPSLQERYHQIIREETLRLERLISDLLDLGRLQSGKIKFNPEPVDIIGIIKGAAARLYPQMEKKQITYSLEAPAENQPVIGDGDRLTQLIIIFLDNAIHYTPESGKITVMVKDLGNQVEVAVSDTGQGIPPEDLPFIWDRFYKVDKSRARTEAGTGLGLAIAREIIQLHGSTPQVESQPGKGSTFKFTLAKWEG